MISDYCKLQLLTEFSLEDLESTTTITVAGIASIVYIAISAVFLLISLINLLAVLGVIKNREIYKKLTLMLLVAMPAFLILEFAALSFDLSAAAKAPAMCGGAIAALIIWAVTTLLFIFTRGGEKKIGLAKIASAVLAIAVMVLAFTPIAKVEYDEEFADGEEGAEINIYASHFSIFDFQNKDMLEDMSELTSDTINEFLSYYLSYFVYSYETEQLDFVVPTYFTNYALMYASYDENPMDEKNPVYLTTNAYLLTILAAGATLAISLYSMITEKDKKKSLLIAKLATVIFALISTIATVAHVLKLKVAISELEATSDMVISYGVGIIIALALAIIALAISISRKKKTENE